MKRITWRQVPDHPMEVLNLRNLGSALLTTFDALLSLVAVPATSGAARIDVIQTIV